MRRAVSPISFGGSSVTLTRTRNAKIGRGLKRNRMDCYARDSRAVSTADVQLSERQRPSEAAGCGSRQARKASKGRQRRKSSEAASTGKVVDLGDRVAPRGCGACRG